MKASGRSAPPPAVTPKTSGPGARVASPSSPAPAETPRATHRAAPRATLPGGAGVATGLALTSGPRGATAATVECLIVPGRGKLILTGNLVGAARDAAQVAVTLARARAKTLGVDPALFLQADVHFHVMDPLPQKGGPSIGLPMFVALVSALTKKPVDKAYAFTGELSLTGTVLPVEGIAEKAEAAARAECARLYAPAENMKELKQKKTSKGLTLHPLDALRDLFVTQGVFGS